MKQIVIFLSLSVAISKNRFLIWLNRRLQFAIWLVFLSACATQNAYIKQEKVTEINDVKSSETSSSENAGEDWDVRENLLKYALMAIGKKAIKGTRFGRDCSGTVRVIFEQAGLSLKGARGQRRQSDSAALFRFVEKIGQISVNDPQKGDLVFFRNTYDVNRNGKLDDGISHVGIITDVQGDKIKFVHFTRGRIVKSDLQDMIRVKRRGASAKTGSELFAGYGKIDLKVLVANDRKIRGVL